MEEAMTDEDRELIRQLIALLEGLRTALAGGGIHIYHHHHSEVQAQRPYGAGYGQSNTYGGGLR